jgi:uncharacterized repeat protein (TIGR03803 family)
MPDSICRSYHVAHFSHARVRSSRDRGIAAIVVAFAVTAVSAQQAATYEIVSSFTISFDSGKAPSSLRQDSDGTFYGTSSTGGTFDLGTLFRMDAAGAVTALHSFSASPDVGHPFSLVRATDGRFYGATPSTVFRFTPSTGEFTTLYTFFFGEAPRPVA